SRIRSDAEHALEGKLLSARDAVELGAAIGRVAEVDAAVRRADDVVGAVELLAVPVRGEGLRRAVVQGRRDLAGSVLAGEQAALAIPGEPARLAARLAKRRHAVGRRPAAQVITRHVTPEQVALARVPERSFSEETAPGDLLERDVGADDRGQARVANLEAGHSTIPRRRGIRVRRRRA